MRLIRSSLLFIILFACQTLFHSYSQESQIKVQFYFTPSCPSCENLEETLLLDFQDAYQDLIHFQKLNIEDEKNFSSIKRHIQKLGGKKGQNLYLLLNHTHLLSGKEEVEAKLFGTIDEILSQNEQSS